MHDLRVAEVRDEISALAISFLTLDIKYDDVVKLLGGIQPSTVGTINQTGCWGSIVSPSSDNASSYTTDVVKAMGFADAILERLWIHVAGCPAALGGGIGLKKMAEVAVKHLTAANTKALFEYFFKRAALQASRMRSRRTTDPVNGDSTITIIDFSSIASESVLYKQEPACLKQSTDERVDARFEELTAGKAGEKRRLTPAGTTPSPSPSPAPAPTVAGTIKVSKKPATGDPPKSGTLKTSISFAPSPSPSPAPAQPPPPPPAPGPDGWTPSWAAGSITSLAKKATGSYTAVQHFNYECGRLGLPSFPCAIQELTGTCRGAPACITCQRQAALGARSIAAPDGLVAKIKAACNTDTAGRIA